MNAARAVIFPAVAAVALIWAAGVFSQEVPSAAQNNTQPPAEEQLKRLSGTVSQIAFAQGYIVVNVDELGYIKVYVPETASVSRGFESIDISGIGLEDSVIVHYKVEDDMNIAVMVRDSTPSKKQWFQ
jgi:hypothetical protein